MLPLCAQLVFLGVTVRWALFSAPFIIYLAESPQLPHLLGMSCILTLQMEKWRLRVSGYSVLVSDAAEQVTTNVTAKNGTQVISGSVARSLGAECWAQAVLRLQPSCWLGWGLICMWGPLPSLFRCWQLLEVACLHGVHSAAVCFCKASRRLFLPEQPSPFQGFHLIKSGPPRLISLLMNSKPTDLGS